MEFFCSYFAFCWLIRVSGAKLRFLAFLSLVWTFERSTCFYASCYCFFWWKSKSIWKNKASGFEISFLKWLLVCFFVFTGFFAVLLCVFGLNAWEFVFLLCCVFMSFFYLFVGGSCYFWILLCRKMQFFACVMLFYYDF